MDIETLHYQNVIIHVRQDNDGYFYVALTRNESEDTLYEAYGFDTVEAAVQHSKSFFD